MNLLQRELVVLLRLLVSLVPGALSGLLLRDPCGSPISNIGFFFLGLLGFLPWDVYYTICGHLLC
jgi:hypothetical protein